MSNIVTLHGGVTYHTFGIYESTNAEDLKDTVDKIKLSSYPWTSSTKLLANFNGVLSGSNFEGDFENIDRFSIYKTIGERNTLHKVCETETGAYRVVEDFTVGDMADIKYHIHAICNKTITVQNEHGNSVEVTVETISPIILNAIRLHRGIVSVIGLIPDEFHPNTYHIDSDNIWGLQLNVSNDGYTLNTDKTFYQTQSTYGKESGGHRKQRSIPISGLLGKIDCTTSEYTDSFDNILDWEDFASSSTPKMLIDLRGIITIGDIEINPSFSYEKTPNHEVSVSFTFNQLNSLNSVDVLGRALPLNPLKNKLLNEAEQKTLQDTMLIDTPDEYNEYLTVPMEEEVQK